MESPAFAAGMELSLSDYWNIFQKRRHIGLIVFALVVAVAVFKNQTAMPVYDAQVIIKYEPPVHSMEGGMAGLTTMGPGVDTQVNLLQSMEMSQRLATKLHVPMEIVPGMYDASRLGLSSLIAIVARSSEPARASNVANTIADDFIAWDLEIRTQQSRMTLNELLLKREAIVKNLDQLGADRQKYLEENPDSALATTLATTVLELQSRREELLRKFTPEHPEVQKIEQRISVATRKLAKLPAQQEALARLTRDIGVQQGAFGAVSKNVEETRMLVDTTLSWISIIARASPPNAPSGPKKTRNLFLGIFMGIVLGFFSTILAENLDISITALEDIEHVMQAPVLGVVPYFGSDNRWQDWRARFGKFERHSNDAFRSFLIFRQPPKSPRIEVYHSIRVNIQAQLPQTERMVLTFTSTGVAEGKTLTSTNFCLASAHSGLKTLLVGADVRRPSLQSVFGLPKQPGLMEVLMGKATLQEAIHGTMDILMSEQDLEKMSSFPGIDNFKVMTGWAHSSAEVVNLFSSSRLTDLIAELRKNFDMVVFDCPPVLLFVDALLIGKKTDGTIIVYKSGKMARRALKRAKDQVVEVSKGRVLGVILNGAKAAEMGPGYGMYYDYGHYAKT